jgi:WD40 repeat protein
MAKIKVLLFAANPRGTVRLDLSREFREIDEEVHRGMFRSDVELIFVPGARPVDLLRKLNENRPEIVHFSSHGNPDEIVLESGDEEADVARHPGVATRSADDRDMERIRPDASESGSTSQSPPQLISKSALVNVLRSCDEGNLRMVVLNACHTRPQAEALTGVVDCVVSMNRTITDHAAIKFAASFYGALAFGRSVRKAFEQGVARLSAEGIAEAETPELLVRQGVDASQLVLVGSEPGNDTTPVPTAPFIVPFRRNADFVGRDGDLARLRVTLSGPGPVGIRPAGLTGMGGIGKTQLAVEYVYRYKDDYPDGIFWIDAAGSLAEGFARLASDHRSKCVELDRPRDEQIRSAFAALNQRPQGLLVLDNLPDPAAIAVPLLPDCAPEDLGCSLLFTTRRHDLGRFAGVEVTVLPEVPALQLLLRHPSRQAALDPAHRDHEHARAIARMLGRLPLALELAGGYLGKFSSQVPLEGYRQGLRSVGALTTLDADAAELTEADLRRVHDPAVAATIGEQWSALEDESARLLLRVASLFEESAAVPIARLCILSGLEDEARAGRLSSLDRAVKRLEDTCLIERLDADQIRLHPLIREFAVQRTPRDQVDNFHRESLERAVAALENFSTLGAFYHQRGVERLQEDLVAILELNSSFAPDLRRRVQAVLRLLQREAHFLSIKDRTTQPELFAQQIRNRAFLLGIASLQGGAEFRLAELSRPHVLICWKATQESPSLVRTLVGHAGCVNAVAATPDGLQALSGSDDGTLKLWDLRSGREWRTVTGHSGPVHAIALTGDGRQALSAGADFTLRLWDLMTGQRLRYFWGHSEIVRSIAVTPDGRRALSASADRTLKLWDLASGDEVLSLIAHPGKVRSVAVTPDGRQAISGSEDGTLTLWDLSVGRALRTLVAHADWVNSVAVTPDGRRALSASNDGTIKLWDLANGRKLQTLNHYRFPVNSVTTTPDGKCALSASDDRTVKVWDLTTGQELRNLVGHAGGVRSVAVSQDGVYALSGCEDGSVKAWDLRSDRQPPVLESHYEAVRAVVVSPDGRQLLSASDDRTVIVRDLKSGVIIRRLTGHTRWVRSVAVTPDGRRAISASADQTLELWDLSGGHALKTLPSHVGPLIWVALTSDGRHAVDASDGGAIEVWDLEAGRVLRSFATHADWVNSVVMTPDSRMVLTASDDGTVKAWDLTDGRELRTFARHTSTMWSVSITPDARHVLTGSADGAVNVWDLGSGQGLHTLDGHTAGVTSIRVTSDGRFVFTSSSDSSVKAWDLKSQRCLATFPIDDIPLSLALAPDSETIAVGDLSGNVYVIKWVGLD